MSMEKHNSVLKVGKKPEAPSRDFTFINHTRFLILVLVTACLSISQSNVLTLNFTIICMAGPAPEISEFNQSGTIYEDQNGSYYETGPSNLADYLYALDHRPYTYTANQKNLLFSFVAIGAIVAVYPAMWLMQKFGSRWVVTLFGFFSALCTALIPLAAYLGFYWLLIMRLLQGMGLATGFTLIGIVTLQWSMKKQSAFYIAVLTTLFQFGPIFTMPVSGALCTSSLGWTAVYYVHGFVTFVLFAMFLYFYREYPHHHSFVSSTELNRITREKGDTTKKDAVPVLSMLKDPAILSCWAASIGNSMGIQITMQFSPTYLNKVLGFSVESTGLLGATPQVVTFFLKLFAGLLADKAVCCSIKSSVKIFNTLSIGAMGLTFFALAAIPTSMPFLGLFMLVLSCSILGFNCGGFLRSSAVVAVQHNHFVMGVNSFINCACALVAPLIVNVFVKDDSWDEWWYVWVTHGIILTVTNIIFCVYAKGTPAEWTKRAAVGNAVADSQADSDSVRNQESKREATNGEPSFY